MDELDNRHDGQPHSLLKAGSPALPVQEVVEVSPEEVPHLRDYWNVVLKRRWVIFSAALLVFSKFAIGTLKQRPLYQGTAVLEVDPEQPDSLNLRDVIQVNNETDADTYRATQFKILKSHTLAERVVQDLQLYRYPEYRRRTKYFGFVDQTPVPLPAENAPLDSSDDLFQGAVGRFMGSMELNPITLTSLVEVSYLSEDPKVAQRVANQIAEDYIKLNLESKYEDKVKASEWLKTQLGDLKARLEKSEDALQAYARANSIVIVDDKINLANARLEQLQTEYTKAQAERFNKESLYNLLQSSQAENLPGLVPSAVGEQLTLKIAQVEEEYAQLTAVVKPNYPKAIQLRKEIDSLNAALAKARGTGAQATINDYRSAVVREKFLAQALAEQTKVVNESAEKTIQYNILKRDVDSNKQLYENLLQRLKEAQMAAGLKASNIRVVDAAELPKGPVRPRVMMNLTLGLFLGLGLGIGLAYFLEYLDNTLKTPEEVERVLRLPSLGVVPSFILNGASKAAGAETRLALTSPQGEVRRGPVIQSHLSAIEAFRSLRTSILLSANPVPKVILITSALPAEGKTTATINLGAAFSRLGSKVVIVDCDMRRPACHHATGVENKPGFVQCLTGHVGLAEALIPVPAVSNLFVIPCGPIPPNPTEILSSPIATELLNRLRSEFEYVLIDSPPVLSVADSRVLATIVDAVVLVTRAFETPSNAVRQAKALLYGAGARILGIALNDVDLRRDGYTYSRYYRYGYGYSYGYGYGYGYAQTPEDGAEADSSGEESRR